MANEDLQYFVIANLNGFGGIRRVSYAFEQRRPRPKSEDLSVFNVILEQYESLPELLRNCPDAREEGIRPLEDFRINETSRLAATDWGGDVGAYDRAQAKVLGLVRDGLSRLDIGSSCE